MPKQTTMKDVAEAAGVHQSTVSLALRNHPRIPEATVERIRKVAEEMGYRPNPLVSALIAGRRRRGETMTATLGYVVGDAPSEGGKTSTQTYIDLLEGVRARAEELGYGLDVLWLGDPEISRKRFHNIARTRAIHGLIVAPLALHHDTLDIAWDEFACVAYGYSMAQPRIHRVCPDFYHSMLELMERTRAVGLRRVGLVLDRIVDAKSDHFWLAAFLADQRIHGRGGHPAVAPLLVDNKSLKGADEWLKKYKPDAVVALPSVLLKVKSLHAKMDGVPAPIWLSLDTDEEFLASQSIPGVLLDRKLAGAACVDVVASLLYRNERGIPRTPQNILLETGWVGEIPHRPRQ